MTPAPMTKAPLAASVPNRAVTVQADVPRGLERADQEDLTLPRILLMQGQSKFVQDKGKKVGTFVNSLTEDSYESLTFIPVVFSKYYVGVRWQGTQRIFEFRTFDKNDPRLGDRLWFRDGDERATAETTMSFICLIEGKPAIIDFTGSSLDGAKKLVTLATLSKKDLWCNGYKLLSVKKTNKSGQVFFAKDVEPLGEVLDPAAYDQAEKMYSAFGAKVEALHKDETQDA